ncbi:MAG: NAD(P)/FAD-dependent oxidoreductase [Chloroflexi bacterium]|nr:NAD(P)/FAD-dependent oxidoreductase [Chloroflexota bacterium]
MLPETAAHSQQPSSARKILILGGGFGGTYLLRHLLPSLNRKDNAEITIVSDENYFLFLPLLHEVATGAIEPRHVACPIRSLPFSDRFKFIRAVVDSVSLSDRRVSTTAGTLDYDYLVLALGSVTDMSGLTSNGGSVFTLKTLHDARYLKNHIISVFEQASVEKDAERRQGLLTFIVTGGGYIGVQLVVAIRDFVFQDLRNLYRHIDPAIIKIMLIETDRKIIPRLHTKLGAYAMRQLQLMGIDVRLKSRVTMVHEDHVEINNTQIVPTNTVIWTPGVAANPVIARLDVKKDSLGRILVSDHLGVAGFPGVYAIGDCAHCEDPKTGQPMPPSAHAGVRQAKVAAHNILADLRGKDKRPYIYSNPFEVVSLGSSRGVFSFHRFRLYGFWARFIWMAGYSLLSTKAYNRIRIVTDWLLSMVFGRDTILLK